MNSAPPLRTPSDIERLLEAHADLHALLLHVERLGLPDCRPQTSFDMIDT